MMSGQKDKKIKRQKERKTKRQKDNKVKRQKDKKKVKDKNTRSQTKVYFCDVRAVSHSCNVQMQIGKMDEHGKVDAIG